MREPAEALSSYSAPQRLLSGPILALEVIEQLY